MLRFQIEGLVVQGLGSFSALKVSFASC